MVVNIQALRALAAMLVVFHHIQGPLNAYLGLHMDTALGGAGVDVFFVISGFIMFRTTRDGARTAGEFWLDRIIRIAPLYWLATFLVLAMFWIGLRPMTLQAFDAEDIATSLSFIPDVRADSRTMPILSVGWTLNFEMFFYLLFGLTFFLRSQAKSLAVLLAVFLGLCAAAPFAGGLPFAIRFLMQPITLEFAAGAALALAWDRLALPRRAALALGYGLLAAGAAVLALADVTVHTQLWDEGWMRTLAFGAPGLAIVAGALILERAGHVWRWPPLALLGAASYAIYLFHLPVIQIVSRAASQALPNPWVVGALAFTLPALAGIVIHLWIEQPVQRLLKSLTRRKPAAATHAAAV